MTDPDYITETDIDEFGPWVECDWGYDHCTFANYACEMVAHDGSWMCPNCECAAKAEAANHDW